MLQHSKVDLTVNAFRKSKNHPCTDIAIFNAYNHSSKIEIYSLIKSRLFPKYSLNFLKIIPESPEEKCNC
jgi:hypothetical protein